MAREPGPHEMSDEGKGDGVVSRASLSAGLAETAPAAPGAAVGKGAALARGAVERDLAKIATGALQCLEGRLVQERR
jgi:hypothetical protein